jgi:uncharacterized protein (DUF1778 family)
MEFKTTNEIKELLSEAAIVSGLDLTSFVLESATRQARAVLTERATLKLTADQHANFLKVLENPPAPSEALRRLMRVPPLPMR